MCQDTSAALSLTAVVKDIRAGMTDLEHNAAKSVQTGSDNRFRAAFTYAAIGFALTTTDGRFVEANPACCALTGYTLDELRGLTFAQLIHPDDRAEYLAQIERMLASEISSFVLENRCWRKDGATAWARHSVSVVREAADAPQAIMALIEDITARKEAEARLQAETRAREESRALLFSLLHSASIGFCFLDRERRYQMINPTLAAMNGLPAADHIGRAYREVVPALADSIDGLFDQIMATGEAVPEFLLTGETLKEPGVQRHWLENWYPVKDSAGQILGIGVLVNEITEQKRVQDALRDSEARLQSSLAALEQERTLLRLILDNLPVGVMVADSTGKCLLLNPVLQAIWRGGVPLESREQYATYRAWNAETGELVGPEDWPISRALLTGEPQPVSEYIIERFDGTRGTLLSHAVPIRDEAGTLIQAVAVGQDITARKQQEAALRAAHDTFRHLVDNSPFGIYAVDADFRLVQVSAGAQKVFENVRPLIGRDFAEVLRAIWPEPFAAHAIGLFRHTLQTGEPYHAPGTVERRQDSGEVEAYDWKIERVTLPDGRFGVVCHFYDLSERQRYEDALNISEARLRLALDAVNGFIFDQDMETGVVFRSPGLLKLTGYAPEELPPTPEGWLNLIHPDDLKSLQAKRRDIHARATTYQGEYRIRHRDGRSLFVVEQGQIVRDDQGAARRIVGTTVDITPQKQAQQEITDLNARLQRAVAETHHRVKNNLQMLSALVEMQLPDGKDAVPVSDLRRIGQHIRTLASLHDLLTRDARSKADNDAVSLKTVLERLTPLLQTAAGAQTIQVTAEEVHVTLKQSASFVLLLNELVSNAAKHGGGRVEVTLRLTSPAQAGEVQTVRLEVCDDGPGFPSDFDPGKAANTGLELIESLVRWDLRGETQYQNRGVDGARVVVTFPQPETS